ncbi:Histidine biosynthesis bifunctional protein hisB, variant 2 [Entomophthora muscae]|uniref:Histidine biosynthesis bifunctional protein hisB, variant 2 n=1 Tax=Entomophthora muscae TaxID=34485 RepID=A0ACC2TZY8_9FUNG|nr:Histidine biosynthesis bifunctional protein hisB, variant 2 [Entomophthora muscae]
MARKIIFPGVGNFGKAMQSLRSLGYFDALLNYLRKDGKFFGICVGMQCLFEGSDEAQEEGAQGLGLIPGRVTKFDCSTRSVPHMGWNKVFLHKTDASGNSTPYGIDFKNHYYFVHSYRVTPSTDNSDWMLGSTLYGEDRFISTIQKGNILGVQFHPEKSGQAGLRLLASFLSDDCWLKGPCRTLEPEIPTDKDFLTKRIVACLDVRANDQGDLVVTKGDQYDVREEGQVRNLGKPIALAKQYYEEGADEIAFLNITSFRSCPLQDQPMLEVLQGASLEVFVPLTVGGGIRDIANPDGSVTPASEVAGAYFRAGADKVSIGSDAVDAAEAYWKCKKLTGSTPIETIARSYGSQAVVVSIDPRRVYVTDPKETEHHTIATAQPGPQGEKFCWFQCTSQGGRTGRDLDVVQLAIACQKMGAGELMINSIDRDGTGLGFDLELIQQVRENTSLPLVASSGAGCSAHFQQVFSLNPPPEAALAAGIFHRKSLPLPVLKSELVAMGLEVRSN